MGRACLTQPLSASQCCCSPCPVAAFLALSLLALPNLCLPHPASVCLTLLLLSSPCHCCLALQVRKSRLKADEEGQLRAQVPGQQRVREGQGPHEGREWGHVEVTEAQGPHKGRRQRDKGHAGIWAGVNGDMGMGHGQKGVWGHGDK